MSQLWVKRAKAEMTRHSRVLETINRVFPMPFEERRSRVGMTSYATYRWLRYFPVILVPVIVLGTLLETRDNPQEHVFTSMHLWLADHGVFRHDTVKALNPAFEDERRSIEWKANDRKWRFTGMDMPSEREIREFAAINIDRQSRRQS
ncbi:hypothetical protein LPMP_343680 [Leishmania panamensis]|uniref:Uncharacterized protein n=8 Tax=Viannia TaxID=37616 RepID=A4HN52_LEIBR|nr:conserved hypothetical protein [Leishmania braziliensis MHOM/BR/75/M2904]XP_010702791.1 hypothetical protein LPMP_343680 [Leishmania panamensis]KAI5689453.1 hypothetical protein MNV84_07615 [Leishmania braziliensis]CCM19206.1 hypothetical protein, conserved [Leishmania guyanensis]AIO01991.1 hypothetical protein LPMP_343680 [Leishmania panamensis]CAJ2480641.1 unnamed protein product [Leishmania braziliensis]CAJ2481004.1 unnamed protein product [Leishmania braziliensis]